jgi:hypothetical protein
MRAIAILYVFIASIVYGLYLICSWVPLRSLVLKR